ncbi:LysR family transcriptional regulator [Klebsiella variicola subsp. variicola]|nr:LysR family transcriptional regulator [Klebsiella variicola subsp. variicola]
MDWQDLHFFFALARCGSLSGRSQELGVDHATVGRRIAALESLSGPEAHRAFATPYHAYRAWADYRLRR